MCESMIEGHRNLGSTAGSKFTSLSDNRLYRMVFLTFLKLPDIKLAGGELENPIKLCTCCQKVPLSL